MSYVVVARRYRPQAFAEVVGQEAVARTLANAIASDRVGHAYLFCGPRGVGKTSMARILARALNCERGPTADPCGVCEPCQGIAAGTDVDVIEIDGASNRGVEDARRLRQSVAIAPSRCRFKIYIIDEVHMLTNESFNTLLKTLEEPPPHVKFILATTEPHRILETIISRCQRFDFRRISLADIVKRLEQIAAKEGVTLAPGVLERVARSSRGGMRDSQTLLDQLIAFSDGMVTEEHLVRILGRLDDEDVLAAVAQLLAGDSSAGFAVVARIYDRGLDPESFLDHVLELLRAVLITAVVGRDKAIEVLEESAEHVARLGAVADKVTVARLEALLVVLLEIAGMLRRPGETQPRLLLELAMLEIATSAEAVGVGEALARLERLEAGGPPAPRARGAAAPASSSAPPAASASAPATAPAPVSPAGARSSAPAAPRAAPSDQAAPRPRAPDQPPSRAPGRGAAPKAMASVAPGAATAVAELPTAEAIAAAWPDFVEEIEAADHALGAVLKDVRPGTIVQGRLELLVPPGYRRGGFHVDTLDASQSALDDRLRSKWPGLAGARVLAGPAPAASPEPRAPEPPAPATRRQRPIEQDPRVARVLQVFRGRVVNEEGGRTGSGTLQGE